MHVTGTSRWTMFGTQTFRVGGAHAGAQHAGAQAAGAQAAGAQAAGAQTAGWQTCSSQWPWSSQTVLVVVVATILQTLRVPWRTSV